MHICFDDSKLESWQSSYYSRKFSSFHVLVVLCLIFLCGSFVIAFVFINSNDTKA